MNDSPKLNFNVPKDRDAAFSKSREMWPAGPLREFTETRERSGTISLETGGFGGSYVCSLCRRSSVGLYRVKDGVEGAKTHYSWICAECKSDPRPMMRGEL